MRSGAPVQAFPWVSDVGFEPRARVLSFHLQQPQQGPLAGHTWSGDAGRVNPFLSPQVTEDALVYSTFLLHNPRPAGNLSILRTNRVEVPIECHYPRSVWPPLAQRPLGKPGSLLAAPGSGAVRRGRGWGCGRRPQSWWEWGWPCSLCSEPLKLAGATATSWGKLQGCPAPSVQKGSLSRAGVGSKR